MDPSKLKTIWVKEKGEWRSLAKGESLPLTQGQEFAVGETIETAKVYQFEEDKDHQPYFRVSEAPSSTASQEDQSPVRQAPLKEKVGKGGAPGLVFSGQQVPSEIHELKIFLGFNDMIRDSRPGVGQVEIADLFYDDGPIEVARLRREGADGVCVLPIDKFQGVPLQVLRSQGEGAHMVTLLKVGHSVNLYDPQGPPLVLQDGDELVVGQQGLKFIFTKSDSGEWEFVCEDPAIEIHFSGPS